MKKLLALIMTAALLLCMAASLAEGAQEPAGIANPWTDTTAEELIQTIGVEFAVPEGAENVVYRMLEEDSLAEMQFIWNEMDYIARIKPTAEFEDISGMYYDPWDYEEACQVGWCEGKVMRTEADGETIDLCLWFDIVPGIMYSISTSGEDLDGFDIQAAAEAVYTPMQSDAEGDFLTSEMVQTVLEECTGYAGTAGSSLKQATAAYGLITYAWNCRAAQADAAALEEAVLGGYDALEDAQKEELLSNLEGLEALIEDAFKDYDAVSGAFEDADLGEALQGLLDDEVYEDWAALREQLLKLSEQE